MGQLGQRQESFKRCAELQAAYLEILNLLASLGCREQVATVDLPQIVTEHRGAASALLDLHSSLKVVYDTATSGDVDTLQSTLLKLLSTDVNTSSRMLDMIPEVWKQVDSASVRSGLCGLYLEACTVSSAPEVQTQALTNLGSLMARILRSRGLAELPSAARLDELWARLQTGDINPALSCAIIETSGTILAVLVSRDSDNIPDMEQRLRSWGDMLSECLDVDNVRNNPTYPPLPSSLQTNPPSAAALRHPPRRRPLPHILLHPFHHHHPTNHPTPPRPLRPLHGPHRRRRRSPRNRRARRLSHHRHTHHRAHRSRRPRPLAPPTLCRLGRVPIPRRVPRGGPALH